MFEKKSSGTKENQSKQMKLLTLGNMKIREVVKKIHTHNYKYCKFQEDIAHIT